MQQVLTIGEVLFFIEKNHDHPKAIVTYEDTLWKALSTQSFLEEIKFTALGLIACGVKRGEAIGILAAPSGRWTIADCAIMAIGAVSIPIFANISNEHFAFEITQPNIGKIFVSGAEQWLKINSYQKGFEKIFSLDDNIKHENALTYSALLKIGKDYEQMHPGNYQGVLKSVKPSEIATIIYTSGTTGVPRGAMHTHRSLCSLLSTDCFVWDSKKDSFLSFLPLAHVFARVINLTMISWGVSVYYYNDIKTLGTACKDVLPTIIIVVPRVLEKVYAKMWRKVQDSSFFKRMIGKLAFKLAHQKESSLLQKVMAPLLDILVYSKLREALGGHLRVIICGGAALNPNLYHFFLNARFPVYEGWGLTESCPVTVNRIGQIKIGSVGLPLPGMLVKVAEGGELLVSGKMLMEGYFGDSQKAIDADGWFHTGDKGMIDQEGFVTLIGRIKELFKTSTGEMIAPIPIEQALSSAPFVEIPMVIAQNKKFVSCLIFPNFDTLEKIKDEKGVKEMNDQTFIQSDIMKNAMTKLLATVNSSLNEWEQIKEWRIVPYSLSVESGELTPSMKLKREVVEQKFSDLIDSIYKEEQA